MDAKLRLLKVMGESGMWKGIGRVHTWLYRATGGRIGHTVGHITNLLLTTKGRGSGAPRTVALAYLADRDTWVLVASNGGADRHPALVAQSEGRSPGQHRGRPRAHCGGGTRGRGG